MTLASRYAVGESDAVASLAMTFCRYWMPVMEGEMKHAHYEFAAVLSGYCKHCNGKTRMIIERVERKPISPSS